MSWALTMEGRNDREGVVLLLDDEREAQRIAGEVRRKGIQLVVRPYRVQHSATSRLDADRS